MVEYTLVLMRHGESAWNLANRFTGWVDAELSEKGKQEAVDGGKLLKAGGYEFDVAYTSLLQRAIITCNTALEHSDQIFIPQIRSWRLNERMYGGLEGLDKAECVEKHGAEQVLKWRRAYDTPPPLMEESSEFNHKKERRYNGIDGEVPMTECLKDCVERVVPYWEKEIVPALKSGKRVFVAAHGNSLRALVKYLDNIADDKIVGLNIPTGVPLVYKLGEDFKPIVPETKVFEPLSGVYLGDVDDVKARIDGVANQTAKKAKTEEKA